MLPFSSEPHQEEGIVIVGLGGAGAHILRRFSGSSAENVRMCIMSPDERLGREIGNVEFLQLGAGLNHGLGSGGDPEVGRQSILESKAAIRQLLAGTRLLVMVVGLGGGTGSGAAPVLAQMANEAGVMLVSVAVLPFTFEGARRREQALKALDDITRRSDIVFCFENDYMEDLLPGRTAANAVFEEAETILAQATAAIPMFANSPGLINIGLDELMAALRSEDSRCIFGRGKGYGPHRAEDAARAAMESPLVAYHNSLRFARAVVVHIAGGTNMSLAEIRTAMETVRKGLPEEADIFFGATVKPRLGEEIRVSVLASVDAGEFREAVLADKAEQAKAAAEKEEEETAEEPAEEETAAPLETEESPDLTAEDALDETEAPYTPTEDGEEETDAETAEEEEEADDPEIFEADDDDRSAYTPAAAPRHPAAPPIPAEDAAYAPPAERDAFAPAVQREETPTAPAPRAAMVQEDLFAPPARQTATGFGGEDGEPNEDDDFTRRVRSLFPEDGAPTPQRSFPHAPAARRRNTAADDLDTPPSLRYNDLRDMFPDE